MSLFSLGRRVKPIVYTIEVCPKCGKKIKRAFKLGDYVYKEGDLCDKCNTKMIITAIYSEEPPK